VDTFALPLSSFLLLRDSCFPFGRRLGLIFVRGGFANWFWFSSPTATFLCGGRFSLAYLRGSIHIGLSLAFTSRLWPTLLGIERSALDWLRYSGLCIALSFRLALRLALGHDPALAPLLGFAVGRPGFRFLRARIRLLLLGRCGRGYGCGLFIGNGEGGKDRGRMRRHRGDGVGGWHRGPLLEGSDWRGGGENGAHVVDGSPSG